MDEIQVRFFIDQIVGSKVVDAVGDQFIYAPINPELRAFMFGVLGAECPEGAYMAIDAGNGEKLADFLQKVVDAIRTKEPEKEGFTFG